MFNNGGDQNLDEFTQELFTKLLSATRISNNLPTEDEYQFYASFKPFKSKMNELGKRLLDLTQNFLQHDENIKAPIINDSDDVDEVTEKFDEVVDFVDRLIEKVDLYAEESSGDKPKSNIVITKVTAPSRGGAKADYNIFHSTNLPRPQLQFSDQIDNSPFPFIPKITHKPNALVPLDPIIVQGQTNIVTKSDLPNLGSGGFYPHPYEYELRALQFLESQLLSRSEILYKSLQDTPYTWIDTVEGLQLLADKLDNVDEIAIDLEAHAYRSFQGFVCLMQVSTRREDFIVDTLALRQHMHILNTSFTNPRIVKVLHGSDGDILWLQRDYGIYIVNLFDTGQAARVLEYPSFGLAYLLKFYCNVDADKKYQLADWRIRELPEEMIKYAREDTHYLLYVYDRLRNELVARGNANNNFLHAVLNRSKELCLRRYEKEKMDDTSHLMLYNKILPNHTTIFNALQMKVFAGLYAWRDNIARSEDESTRYVLPNQMMFEVAAQMPTETNSLFTCCAPVPPLVKTHAADIIQIIKRTKQQQQALPHQPPIAESPAAASFSSRPFFPNVQFYPQAHQSHQPHQLHQPHPPHQSHPLPIQQVTQQQQPPQQQQQHQQPQKQYSPLDSPAPHTTKNAETPIANGYQRNKNKKKKKKRKKRRNNNSVTRIRYNTHKDIPSPVLSTEQLYKVAGWLTEDDPEPFKQSNDDTPVTPLSPITRTRRKAILAKASTGVLFSAQSSSDSEDGEEEDEAKRTAALIRSSFSSIVTASFPSFAAMVAPSSSIPKPTVSAKVEDEADGDDESEIKPDAEDVGSSDETKQQPTTETAPTKKVPRSMAEIYKLSNQNRKRNKEKKKMKEDSLNTHPSSPVVLDENESSPVSRNKKQKTNHKRESEKDKGEKEDKKEKEDKERGAGVPVEEGEDTMQFMKEIGWITKGAEAKPPATTTTTTTSNNNNSTSNPNNNNSNMNVQAGNASGPGDVKSSASHANKSHHAPAAHTHHHAYADSHDAIASSSPPRKSRPAQQQQSPKQPSARTQPQHTPHHAPPHHQQPMQHITAKAHHGPNSGHSGAPLPNFAAFDYSSAPNFGMASHPMNVPNPGQFFNPYNNSTVSSQSRVNPSTNNIRRTPAASTTSRPSTHHQQQRGAGGR